MKKSIIFIIIFNIASVLYLSYPLPKIEDLHNSIKSMEPGDTTQLTNVSGYYTNMTRTEVINSYKARYTSPFLININHPPEKSKQIFRDTMQSYYLEEFVIPFKQSLYINGFEWENDVFTKPEKRISNKLLYEGKEYKAKITIRTFTPSITSRFITYFFIEFVIITGFIVYKSYFKKHG